MDNYYFYCFYILAKFAHKVKKDDKDFAFTALMLLSTPMFLNILAIILVLGGFKNMHNKSSVYLLSIFIVAPVVAVNYYFLMRRNRNEKIIKYYDEKTLREGVKSVMSVLFLLYFIISILLTVHLATRD